jgi:hypothetical protein
LNIRRIAEDAKRILEQGGRKGQQASNAGEIGF